MCIHACCRHNNGIGAWSRGLAADVVAQVMAQLRHAIHNVYKAGAELVIPVRKPVRVQGVWGKRLGETICLATYAA